MADLYNMTIEQGATLQLDLYWTGPTSPPVAIDVTGYTAKMQIRSQIGSPAALETWTTDNGRIIMGTTDGHIKILVPATETGAITWITGIYDLIVVSPGGFATKLMQGTVIVNQSATLI